MLEYATQLLTVYASSVEQCFTTSEVGILLSVTAVAAVSITCGMFLGASFLGGCAFRLGQRLISAFCRFLRRRLISRVL